MDDNVYKNYKKGRYINALRTISIVIIGFSIGSLLVTSNFWISILLVVPVCYIIFFSESK